MHKNHKKSLQKEVSSKLPGNWFLGSREIVRSVPQLTVSPVNTKTLLILASVAGEALIKHLAKILPALLSSLPESHSTPEETVELGYA